MVLILLVGTDAVVDHRSLQDLSPKVGGNIVPIGIYDIVYYHVIGERYGNPKGKHILPRHRIDMEEATMIR